MSGFYGEPLQANGGQYLSKVARRCLAQNSIDESPCPAGMLRSQTHRLVHYRVGSGAHEHQFMDGDAKDLQSPLVDLLERPARQLSDNKVQPQPPAQHAADQFPNEAAL